MNWLYYYNALLKYVPYILMGLGIWIIIDGVGSIWKYEAQTPLEQLVRIIRVGVGILVTVLGYVFRSRFS